MKGLLTFYTFQLNIECIYPGFWFFAFLFFPQYHMRQASQDGKIIGKIDSFTLKICCDDGMLESLAV